MFEKFGGLVFLMDVGMSRGIDHSKGALLRIERKGDPREGAGGVGGWEVEKVPYPITGFTESAPKCDGRWRAFDSRKNGRPCCGDADGCDPRYSV